MSLWFKFYGQDFLTDPKMMKLNAIQKLMWIGLLSMASGRDSDKIKFLSEDNLKVLIGLDSNEEEWGLADNSFKRFEELEMVKIHENTTTLLNFSKRQESNLTGYERVKRYRDRHSVINDNTDSVIKDNIEEKRREENRIDKNIYNSVSFLKSIPETDLKELSDKYEVSFSFIRNRAEDVLDYCQAKGKVYKDYKAALRNFIKSHLESHPGARIKKTEPVKREPDFKRTPEEQAEVRKAIAEGKAKIIKKI